MWGQWGQALALPRSRVQATYSPWISLCEPCEPMLARTTAEAGTGRGTHVLDPPSQEVVEARLQYTAMVKSNSWNFVGAPLLKLHGAVQTE